MTYEELERSIQELVRVMDRHALEWNDRFASLTEAMKDHEEGAAEMRAAMARLFERMDRFIQGLERENGQK